MRILCFLGSFVLVPAVFASVSVADMTTVWHDLLSKHVDKRGAVSYLGFAKDRAKLASYLAKHQKLAVGKLSENTKKAVYINLYNAFMISCILRYARENKISLTDKKKFLSLEINAIRVSGGNIWNGDYKVNLAGQMVNLDDIEHGLLRGKTDGKLAQIKVKTLDPRIHMAVNCAAKSCPRLREKAYTENNVEQMLTENVREFVNAGKQLRWLEAQGKVALNKIILWYYEDFDQQKGSGGGGAGDYLINYMSATTAANTKLVRQLRANLNDRSKLALRFSRAFDFFYVWRINDTRNF